MLSSLLLFFALPSSPGGCGSLSGHVASSLVCVQAGEGQVGKRFRSQQERPPDEVAIASQESAPGLSLCTLSLARDLQVDRCAP